MGHKQYHSAVQEIITIYDDNGTISWVHFNRAGQEAVGRWY